MYDVEVVVCDEKSYVVYYLDLESMMSFFCKGSPILPQPVVERSSLAGVKCNHRRIMVQFNAYKKSMRCYSSRQEDERCYATGLILLSSYYSCQACWPEILWYWRASSTSRRNNGKGTNIPSRILWRWWLAPGFWYGLYLKNMGGHSCVNGFAAMQFALPNQKKIYLFKLQTID